MSDTYRAIKTGGRWRKKGLKPCMPPTHQQPNHDMEDTNNRVVKSASSQVVQPWLLSVKIVSSGMARMNGRLSCSYMRYGVIVCACTFGRELHSHCIWLMKPLKTIQYAVKKARQCNKPAVRNQKKNTFIKMLSLHSNSSWSCFAGEQRCIV